MNTPINFKMSFLAPRFWGIWLGVGILWLISRLPLSLKFTLGRKLGILMQLLSPSRKKLARANIQLAFPTLSYEELQQQVKHHFESLGISLIELSIVWWGSYKNNAVDAIERKLVHYEGIEHLEQAQARGKGVLILAPHFTTLEMTGLFISFLTHFNAIYRPHDNPLMDYLIAKGRSIPLKDGRRINPISNRNTRDMLKALRNGECITILPDQRYRSKGHVTVPFFNQPAKSNPATTKLAKLTNCAVVPCITERTQDYHYTITFLPMLQNFPSDSAEQDTLLLHHLYEQAIRQNPSQYLWVHNRWDLAPDSEGNYGSP